MASYDEQFESQLKTYRNKRRLLVARSIHYKANPADFKKACRAKLSKPDTVRFFWQTTDKPGTKHRGWAMLGFELRTDCRRAEEELQGLKLRNREVKVQQASRTAYIPQSHSTTQPATPSIAAPAVTTPVAAAPAVTTPVAAAPNIAAPAIAAPAAAVPAVTTPAAAAPAIVTPTAAAPAIVTPAAAAPAIITPAATADDLPKVPRVWAPADNKGTAQGIAQGTDISRSPSPNSDPEDSE